MAVSDLMLRRIFSALVLIPLVLALVYYAGPAVMLAVLGVLGTLGLHEYFTLIRAMDLRIRPWLGYPLFWMLIIVLSGEWLPAAPLAASILIILSLSAVWTAGDMRGRALGMMASLLGVLYLGLPLISAYRIRFEFGEKAGFEWIILLLAVTWTGDTAAMVAGKAFGRTPFAPAISPKKTNEGAAAGLAGGLAAGMLLQLLLFTDLPLLHVLAASALICVFGQLGDLAESLLKRAAGAKDSSQLIPGHGGVLDRIDSLLFAFPALHIYLTLLYVF